MGFPKIRGYLFAGPSNKDENILGSILGSYYFDKLPLRKISRILSLWQIPLSRITGHSSDKLFSMQGRGGGGGWI